MYIVVGGNHHASLLFRSIPEDTRVFIPASHVIKAEMIFQHNGQICENVYNIDAGAVPNTESLLAVGAALVTWWGTELKAFCNPDTVLQEVLLTSMDSEDGPAISYTVGLPIAGTDTANEAEPGNVTIAIKWHTAKRGRSFQGRTYHIGLTEGSVDGNTLPSVTVAAFVEAYTALLEAIEDLSMVMSVVSYVHNKAPRTVAEVTPIESVSIDPNLDSQRRRLAGRGR